MSRHEANTQLADAMFALELSEERYAQCEEMARAAVQALSLAQNDVRERRAEALRLAREMFGRRGVPSEANGADRQTWQSPAGRVQAAEETDHLGKGG